VAGAADHAAWNDKPLASGGVRHKRDADCFGAAAVLPVSGAPSCRYVGPYLDGCGAECGTVCPVGLYQIGSHQSNYLPAEPRQSRGLY
jgi:hypothetical protein